MNYGSPFFFIFINFFVDTRRPLHYLLNFCGLLGRWDRLGQELHVEGEKKKSKGGGLRSLKRKKQGFWIFLGGDRV
jgi:hypothetical protein